MNYYEFVNPYYVLIKADCGESAVKEYIGTVAGDTDEFESLLEECKLVPEYYAVAKFSRAKGEKGELMEFEEVMEILKSNKTELLVIDGSLL